MEINKYKLISLFFLFLIIISSILTFKMPLSKKIALMKDINIVFFTPQPLLVEINTVNKSLIIKEINTRKDFLRSKLDAASQIISEYSSNTDSIIYIETTKSDFNLIIECIKNWREKPRLFFIFIRKMIQLETNMNIFDKTNIITELLKVKKNNILNLKITITNSKSEEEKNMNTIPLVSLLIHDSKYHLSKKIISDMRKNQIDVVEEKRVKKARFETFIEIKDEKNINIAKKIITVLNPKKDIPIKTNPKTIYDATINIGYDFE